MNCCSFTKKTFLILSKSRNYENIGKQAAGCMLNLIRSGKNAFD